MQLIAEIAQAHDGSLGIAHSYIDALAETGVDVIKFQTHLAAAESSIHEPFRTKFSYEDEKRIDYWKRMEFTQKQWKGLKKHCDEKNIEFLSSPFSNAAVDLLETINVDRYKVGSGEVNNFLLLEKIARTGKPIILSSGMSSLTEIDKAIQFLQKFDNELSVLQCTTAYPTSPEQWGLNIIDVLKNRYSIPVGFSDHSGDIYACLAAAAFGAQILEFHVVFDKRMFGPDSKASLTIDEVKKLVKGARDIENSLMNEVSKSDSRDFENLKKIFEKSLTVNTDLKKGHTLTFSDLDAKKPKGFGIKASDYQKIIGKVLKRDMKKWEFLNYDDLNE